MAEGSVHPDPAAARPLNKRQRAKAATRQKVLDAGKALFETVGYEAATIRAIAARAGMSTGAVFANFDDKRALYVAAFGHPPLTPEQGRALLLAARRVITAKNADWESANFDDNLTAAYSAIESALGDLSQEEPLVYEMGDDGVLRGLL